MFNFFVSFSLDADLFIVDIFIKRSTLRKFSFLNFLPVFTSLLLPQDIFGQHFLLKKRINSKSIAGNFYP